MCPIKQSFKMLNPIFPGLLVLLVFFWFLFSPHPASHQGEKTSRTWLMKNNRYVFPSRLACLSEVGKVIQSCNFRYQLQCSPKTRRDPFWMIGVHRNIARRCQETLKGLQRGEGSCFCFERERGLRAYNLRVAQTGLASQAGRFLP